MSYSINFKGKPDPKNPSLVKIEMIFFKTDYARVPKVINITGLYKDWDQKQQMFIGNTNESLERNKLLLNLKIKYNKVAAEWEEEGIEWRPTQWSHYFDEKKSTLKKKVNKNITVLSFILSLEERFKNTQKVKNGKVVTCSSNSELYKTLRNSLSKFTKEEYSRAFSSFHFDEIDSEFFESFAFFIQKEGVKNGTKGGIVNKLKTLRSTLNHADKAKIPGVDRSAYVGVQQKMVIGKTTPKTIPYEYIKRIEKLELSGYKQTQKLHIDAFLFSFYTGGMSPVDVINLTFSSFNDNKIIYERMKTPKEAKMPVVKKALDIIDKYKGKCHEDYVLPIIKPGHNTEKKIRNRVSGFTEAVNKTLKKVAKDIKYKGKITWYSARGTYISTLIDEKYPVEIVAEHAGNSPEVIYKHYYLATKTKDIAKQLDNLFDK